MIHSCLILAPIKGLTIEIDLKTNLRVMSSTTQPGCYKTRQRYNNTIFLLGKFMIDFTQIEEKEKNNGKKDAPDFHFRFNENSIKMG
jgi:hypothetical protein